MTATNQSFFTTAYKHAQTMRAPSAYLDGGALTNCVYRTPDGTNCCLVGANISDDDYQSSFDVSSTLADVLAETGNGAIDLDLARDIQCSHDRRVRDVFNDTISVKTWRANMLAALRTVATNFNLEIPND